MKKTEDELINLLEDWEQVKYRMEEEGFDYCWSYYSNFKEIEDEEFHKLRKLYIEISEKLEKYVEDKVEEVKEQLDNFEDIEDNE
ncbi:hypothetical protein M0Q50_10435 [bacterium]|jgi:hypothetical protein|nr:hypothetical protein [bacterium]